MRGVYVAGGIVAGSRTNEIFIENGRFHGHQIAADLKRKLGGSDLASAGQEALELRKAGKLQSAE